MRAAAVRRKLAVATIKMRSLIHSDSSIDNPNLQEPLGNSFKTVPKRSFNHPENGGKRMHADLCYFTSVQQMLQSLRLLVCKLCRFLSPAMSIICTSRQGGAVSLREHQCVSACNSFVQDTHVKATITCSCMLMNMCWRIGPIGLHLLLSTRPSNHCKLPNYRA